MHEVPPLFDHQVVGVQTLTTWNDPGAGRVAGGCFLLADEQGAGKTRQVIDSMQALYAEGRIKRAIIVAPATVRPVWFDPELGQLSEYLLLGATVTEYRPRSRSWTRGDGGLEVIVTNYEFIRKEKRLEPLLEAAGEDTLLILDESAAIKSPNSLTTKACHRLRQRCGWVWLLNGTPVAEHPGDLYAQARVMDKAILGVSSWWQFRSRYAIMGGFKAKQIVGWTNLEDLTGRLAPYTLRRLKKDCLDLPPKMPPVRLEVPMTRATWQLYKDMREDALVYLDENHSSVAPQAITRIMRLAQLTSGLLGGVRSADAPELDPEVRRVSSEKLEALLDFVRARLEEDPNFKVLIWSRFRAEVFALEEALRELMPTAIMVGGQKKEDRERALRILHPAHATEGPAAVVGITRTGATGVNLAAAHHVVYVSNDHSLFVRGQSEERVHRPGQVSPVSYYDILATGPDGQKTVDHAIQRALKRKHDTATWTCGEWATELRKED
jgi:SNF2 family DNA or RNA helicase